MKYPAHIYAKALAEVIMNPRAKDDKIVRAFMALVRKNGDESRLLKIAHEAGRLARRRMGIRRVTIESARPLNNPQKKMVQKFIKKNDEVEMLVRPDLIAGIKVVVNDESQFDGSLKAKLDEIFGS